jgi:hypothetical protein
MGRAKALGVLLLPIIAFAAIVFLAWAFGRLHPAGVTKKASRPTSIGAQDWLSADTASSAGATIDVSQTVEVSRTTTEGSDKTVGKNPTGTTVRVYTITPKY